MSLLPVAARSLHLRRVRLRDFVIERASVFPFFDREGRDETGDAPAESPG